MRALYDVAVDGQNGRADLSVEDRGESVDWVPRLVGGVCVFCKHCDTDSRMLLMRGTLDLCVVDAREDFVASQEVREIDSESLLPGLDQAFSISVECHRFEHR